MADLTTLIKQNPRKFVTLKNFTHACENHENKSVKGLIRRGIPVASTFQNISKDRLWDVVCAVVEDRAEEIADWAEDLEDRDWFKIFIEREIDSDLYPEDIQGITLINGEELLETDGFIIILYKYTDRYGNDRFDVLNVYPYNTKYPPE